MLYRFFKLTTRFLLKVYFRKIYINGLENIPTDGPLILVSNHPTAFLEPCLLACFLPRELYFLVRADLFKKPVLSKLLYGTNQLPIYRFRDGIKELRNSHKIINKTIENVASGNALLIFPEASTTEVRYLRPIKKGAARMALDTLKLHANTDLKIIPIGLNYSCPNRFRSIVNIQIGKAIIPTLPADEKDIPKEIHRLTDQIRKGLEKQVLHLENHDHAPLLDQLVKIRLAETKTKSFPQVEYENETYFKSMKSLSDKINQGLEEVDIEQVTTWNREVQKNEFNYLVTPASRILNIFVALILMPFVLICLLINFIPAFIGKALEVKYVREREFQASVFVAATMGAYILLFTCAFIVGIVLFGWYAFLLLLVPVLGLIGLVGYDYIKAVFQEARIAMRLGNSKKEAIFDEALVILEKFKY